MGGCNDFFLWYGLWGVDYNELEVNCCVFGYWYKLLCCWNFDIDWFGWIMLVDGWWFIWVEWVEYFVLRLVN